MNYFVLILAVLLFLGALDLLPAPRHMHYALWLIAFFFTAIMCSAKFYYGVDVSNYFIYYNQYPPLDRLWMHQIPLLPESLEPGFYVFSCVCKALGLSFFSYTVIISLIFWSAVYCLFRKIQTHRVFALLLLFVLNKDLIFEQYRQCLAVAFLIFAYLAYDRRRYLLAAAMLLLMVLFHKSGAAMLAIIAVALVLQYFHFSYKWYYVLMALMLVLLVLDSTAVVQFIYDHIDTSSSADARTSSIAKHLIVARRLQVILPLYLAMMLAMAQREKRNSSGNIGLLGAMALISAAIIALLYPYYLMLGRLRSYLMPFILLAVMEYLDNEDALLSLREKVYSFRVPIITCAYVIVAYMANVIITRHPIPYQTTIFDTTPDRIKHMRDKNLLRAHFYWNYEYEKENANDVKATKY